MKYTNKIVGIQFKIKYYNYYKKKKQEEKLIVNKIYLTCILYHTELFKHYYLCYCTSY